MKVLPERTAGTPSSPGVVRTIYAADAHPDVPHRSVLVVDDTEDLADLIAGHMKSIASDVRTCTSGKTALFSALHEKFDLIVLDIGLPDTDGLEICRALRTSDVTTPIIILSARAGELDRIVGLEFGADDYMAKPFSMLELLARAKALFRRSERLVTVTHAVPASEIMIGALRIIPASRQVFRDAEPIPLTEKEFDLLTAFADNPGRVLTRNQLLDLVWGVGNDVYEYSVTSHINRLRAKVESDPAKPKIIETVWGVGYRLQPIPAD